MHNFNEKNLRYFGESYEKKVLKQIIGTKELKGDKYKRDAVFGKKMIHKISNAHFENNNAKILINYIKEYYNSNTNIPFYDTLESIIKTKNVSNELQVDILMEYLKQVKCVDDEDAEYVKQNSIDFINTKNIYLAWQNIENNYINKGKYSDYKEIAQIMSSAIVEMEDEDELEAFTEGFIDDLEEGQRHPIPTGIAELDSDMSGGLSNKELALVIAALKVGKAQPNTCRIYTPNGYKLMGEIQVGDEILGSDGKSQKVLGVYPQGLKDVYEVSFEDGSKTQCCKEHLWTVQDRKCQDHFKKRGVQRYLTKDLEEISKDFDKITCGYIIPKIKPFDFTNEFPRIHPYLLGFLLVRGDYFRQNLRFYCTDQKQRDLLQTFLPNGTVQMSGFTHYTIDCEETLTVLKELGLFDKKQTQKFIPHNALFSSLENRRELFRGMHDAGVAVYNGKMAFTTLSAQLQQDFKTLLFSLGGFIISEYSKVPSTAQFILGQRNKKQRIAYRTRFNFSYPFGLISYFGDRQKKYQPLNVKPKERRFKSIEFVGKVECTCLKVSNPDELYVTTDMILTHNTTFGSYICNHASLQGYNVLQIVFEDTKSQIFKKHRSKFSGMGLNAVGNVKNKKTVITRSDAKLKKIKDAGGSLVIHKMDCTNTKVSDIDKLLQKAKNRGVYFQNIDENGVKSGEFKKISFDMVVIDYIDVLKTEGKYKESYEGDAEIMRGLERVATNHDLAVWAFTQGGRTSTGASLVTVDMMGGGLSKAKIGHFIMSIGRSLEQRLENEGTISVLGSRVGRDGHSYKCIFNNGTMEIEVKDKGSITNITTDEIYKNKKK